MENGKAKLSKGDWVIAQSFGSERTDISWKSSGEAYVNFMFNKDNARSRFCIGSPFVMMSLLWSLVPTCWMSMSSFWLTTSQVDATFTRWVFARWRSFREKPLQMIDATAMLSSEILRVIGGRMTCHSSKGGKPWCKFWFRSTAAHNALLFRCNDIAWSWSKDIWNSSIGSLMFMTCARSTVVAR